MSDGNQVDPELSAKNARLPYVGDDTPGIRRSRAGDDFVYVAPGGEPIEDVATLARIRSLAIPRQTISTPTRSRRSPSFAPIPAVRKTPAR